jgi:hypothetical protein
MSGCFSLLPIRTFDELEVSTYDVVIVIASVNESLSVDVTGNKLWQKQGG